MGKIAVLIYLHWEALEEIRFFYYILIFSYQTYSTSLAFKVFDIVVNDLIFVYNTRFKEGSINLKLTEYLSFYFPSFSHSISHL